MKKEEIKYNRQELQLLYWQAKARDIKKKELKDIKKALYEIVSLGQYSPDFLDLIKILKTLPDKALKSIENGDFTKFYTILAKQNNNEYGPFYKGNFYNCNMLLRLLYTDYSKISTNEEFNTISNSFIMALYIKGNEELLNIIYNINPHLSYILEDYQRYKEYGPKYNFNTFDSITHKLNDLYHDLQTTLLMNMEPFNYQYTLPTNIILFLLENIETTRNTIIESYSKYEDKYQFCKIIINEYIKFKNSEDILNNKQLEEQINEKTKKLLNNKNCCIS